MRRIAASALLAFFAVGCVNGTARSPSSTAETKVKPETATIQYWVNQPVTTRVTSSNYDALWNACDRVAWSYLFQIDRTDYREGVLTTKPLVSKYFLEFWRNDVGYSSQLENSSLAVYRRTIRYEIKPTPDGKFEAGVKVVIERSSTFERRVTTAIQYRDAFDGPRPGTKFYADDGGVQPYQTWYAVGRDADLEASIGRNVEKELR